VRTGLALLEQRISLRQGAGGSAMRALIEDVFLRDASEVVIFWRPVTACGNSTGWFIGKLLDAAAERSGSVP